MRSLSSLVRLTRIVEIGNWADWTSEEFGPVAIFGIDETDGRSV